MAGEYITWHKEEIVKAVQKNLQRNFFDAIYFESLFEAQNHICSQIEPGMQVAFGGSMTVRAMNIREYAKDIGANIIDHSALGYSKEEQLHIMRKELTSDLFICSSNAITYDGHLINVDGNGNRVAAMIFGPKKVIIAAGYNKIVRDEKEAFKRIEHIAAPMNMKRLDRVTPCCQDGTCHDCSANERGCRAYTILRRKPSLTPIEIVLIGEMMGM